MISITILFYSEISSATTRCNWCCYPDAFFLFLWRQYKLQSQMIPMVPSSYCAEKLFRKILWKLRWINTNSHQPMFLRFPTISYNTEGWSSSTRIYTHKIVKLPQTKDDQNNPSRKIVRNKPLSLAEKKRRIQLRHIQAQIYDVILYMLQ